MTIATVPVFDATHEGIASLPAGQAAGYATGSGTVPWTPADWAAHPGAVRIAQSPFEPADDLVHADVLDVETGAATPADGPGWYRSALAAYTAGTRPGQRYPCIYCNMSTLPAVANALVAAGITAGPKLWLAEPSLSQAAAARLVGAGGGPWPVIGVQWRFAGSYDESAVSGPWLAAVSIPAGAFHGEYVTGGMFDLAQLAAKLGTTPATLLRMTAIHYGTFGDALAGYLNAICAGTLPVTAPLPKGIQFWVD